MKAKTTRNRFRLTAAAAALLLCGFGPAVQAACPENGATPMNIGPVNPQNGFPLWVQDSNGLTIELCLDSTPPGSGLPPNCFFDPPQPTPFSQQIGFGAEGFWASADTAVVTSGAAAIDAIMVSAVEAAFNTEAAIDGDQFPFTRLRIRIDIGQAGIYTVTHPWGQEQFTVDVPGVRAINESFDIAFAANSVHQGRIGPILTFDPITDAPLGFIGDGVTDHVVTGSPCGTNFFRIEAVGLDGVTPVAIDPNDIDGIGGTSSVQTDLFTVTGKIFTGVAPTPLVVDGVSYSRTTNGHVDVFATSAPTALVTFAGGPNMTPGDLPMLGDGAGLFYGQDLIGDAGTLPAAVAVTATQAGNDPTTLITPLHDQVTISLAEYDGTTGTLTVTANSSDEGAVHPGLSLNPFGTFPGGPLDPNTGILEVITAVPPATVTVASTAGGQDTEAVQVIAGLAPGNTAPVAVDDLANTDEDTAVIVDLAANDFDPDAPANDVDPTTVTVSGAGPTNGSVVNHGDGTVTYTPAPQFNGQDSFDYVVQDTVGAFSNVATVTVNVAPVNDPPVAADDVAAVNINNSVFIDVLANDFDVEGNIDPATVTIVTNGGLGNAVAQLNGLVEYTAGAVPGQDSFTYTVADTAGDVSNTATVTVNVNDVPGEVVSIGEARFRQRIARWRVSGSTTVAGPGNTATATLVRTGQEIASVPVSTLGTYSIDVRGSAVIAVDGDEVLVETTSGATAQAPVAVR